MRYLTTADAVAVLAMTGTPVAASTIRDWARRGLIRPQPGSRPRRPLWDPTELAHAQTAPKPRRAALTETSTGTTICAWRGLPT